MLLYTISANKFIIIVKISLSKKFQYTLPFYRGSGEIALKKINTVI